MKPLTSRSWTRRLALVLLVLLVVTLPVVLWAYSTGTAVHVLAFVSPGPRSDELILASGESGGKASGPSRGSTNLLAADTTPPVITYVLTPSAPNGLNGWYRTNVTLVWTVTDPESAVTKIGCVDQNITSDQAETAYTCSATSAGGTAPTVTVKIKRDATAPKPPLIDAKNADGTVYTGGTWTRQNVTIRFNPDGTDLSGFLLPCTGGITIDKDYFGTRKGECTDKAGNTGASSSIAVRVDKIAPTATLPPPMTGWSKTDVTVNWNWADGTGSGIDAANCTTSKTSTGEGTIQLQATCKDIAGNSATVPYTVNVDKTPPYYYGAKATKPDGSDYIPPAWTNTPVNVTFQCTDALSGAINSSVTVQTTGEGANMTLTSPATGCTDKAGNTSTTGSDYTGLYIDLTKPVINVTRTPDKNANGWNNTDVKVTFTCTDALSGVAPTSNVGGGGTYSNEGVYTSITSTGNCIDNAGNTTGPVNAGDVKIDKTKPNAPKAVVNPAPVNGWNNTDVTVTFAANGDNLSGVASCTAPQTLTNETAGTDVSGTCTDLASNVGAATTVTIKIDKTKPLITGTRTPAANNNNWNNTPVTVSFTCAEQGSVQSGLANPNVQGGTLSTEGQGLSVTSTGSCADNAGNIANAVTVGGINIDWTKPNPPTGSRSPLPNAAGWNNTPVTVNFGSNADTGPVQSGVVWCSPAFLQDKDTPLAGVPVTGTCKDAAGNESAASTPVVVKVDMTAPYYGAPATGGMAAAMTAGITAISKGLPYTAGAWTNDSVIVSFQCSDDLSGPVTTPVVKTVTTEGANQSATATKQDCMDVAGNAGIADKTFAPINIDYHAPVITITPGLGCAEPTFTAVDALSGVATQSGQTVIKDGGYVFVATATDYAGNTATAELPFTPYKGDGSLLLAPIHEKGDNLFKLGSVIPIKFRLIDCSGRPVTNKDARLKVVFLGSPTQPAGTVESIGSPGNADTGNRFRYDNASGQYIFNWGTKGLWVGDYVISVKIDGLEFKGTQIGLR